MSFPSAPSAPSPPSPPSLPVRILVLHGFRDCGALRRVQMRTLVRSLSPLIDFSFADSPFPFTDHGWSEYQQHAHKENNESKQRESDSEEQATDESDVSSHGYSSSLPPSLPPSPSPSPPPSSSSSSASNDPSTPVLRQWMSFDIRRYTDPSSYEYDTLAPSLRHVVSLIQSDPQRIDGVLGFSQGGVVAATLLLYRGIADWIKRKHECPSASPCCSCPSPPFIPPADQVLPDCIRFCLIVGAPMIGDRNVSSLLRSTCPHTPFLPNMHFGGVSDRVVPVESSRRLAECFPNALFHKHKFSHIVPSNAVARGEIKAFVSKAMGIELEKDVKKRGKKEYGLSS